MLRWKLKDVEYVTDYSFSILCNQIQAYYALQGIAQ
jgi:hypothetical protein